jgi:hypothetical protein
MQIGRKTVAFDQSFEDSFIETRKMREGTSSRRSFPILMGD